ncbi:hypothetical protein Fmac_027124 [Flemingia macrophylla]|uniref:Uncharacterized protein n=1 Tax=Flemingia macrophylla TaxID=520843 RepID=A0ABD1LIH3_9FABA
MAGTAVSLAGQHSLPNFLEAVNMLKDLPNEVADFTAELQKFQHFINGADKVAEAEKDDSRRDKIKERVMRLRKASFRMEDIIDEYMICEEKQPDGLGCAALPCEAVDFIKTLIHRIKIAYQIQEIKSVVRKERDGFKSVFPVEETPNNYRGNQNVTWHRLRMAPLYTEEDEVVGFGGPKDKLKDWLLKGKLERTVISVVGMGGQGKTTLAKMVFESKEVFGSFDCLAWITVSQSYTVEGVLGKMLRKFGLNVSTMDQESLIDEVRDYLRHKRYVICFDDVWDKSFWDDIEFALIDNKNGSRIVITTRNEEVVELCKKSTQVHKLEPLGEEESLRLFYKKAFQDGSDGHCPDELKDISLEIVRKCKGLPLAIVVIGGLLSQKDESALEWRLCTQSLSVALERNSDFRFGLYIGERNQSISSGVVRHLEIAAGSEDLFGRIEGSYVRSIQIIRSEKLSEHLVRSIPTECMLLKVLQFESTLSIYAPKNLGNLIYLKYLSFRGGKGMIPKSIGNLQNLETLEAYNSMLIFLPKEISKLRKLRHLLVGGFLTAVKDCLGDMTSLEQLYTLVIDEDGVMISELKRLNKLRDLRLCDLRKEHGRTLGSSINKMQFLEKLHINAKNYKEVIDLHIVSPKSRLRNLLLRGRLVDAVIQGAMLAEKQLVDSR